MSGPLTGIRVVEVAGIGPGPYCAMLLGDLGADVVRVERPGGATTLVAPEHEVVARNRRSVVIDLKAPGGVALLLELADRAHVLLEGFRPGVAERLGFGPDDVLRRNPLLVYGRMTGWGQTGPLAQTAGHDINYLALTGALHAIGRADGPPQVPVNLLGDYGAGGLLLAFGVVAGLLEAQRSGSGQVVDAAIVDGTVSLMSSMLGMLSAGAWQDERGTNLLDTGAPFYDVYEAGDGGYLAVGCLEPQFYAEFVRLMELGDLPDRADQASWPSLRQAFAKRFAERSRDEWAAVFAGSDACVSPVLSLHEAAVDPHLRARASLPTCAGVTQPAPVPRFSRTPGQLRRPPVRPGQHTREVLDDWGIAGVEDLLSRRVVLEESG